MLFQYVHEIKATQYFYPMMKKYISFLVVHQVSKSKRFVGQLPDLLSAGSSQLDCVG